MAVLFLVKVLIGPVGMVTRTLLNYLGWAESRSNSFSFLCLYSVCRCGLMPMGEFVIMLLREEEKGENVGSKQSGSGELCILGLTCERSEYCYVSNLLNGLLYIR